MKTRTKVIANNLLYDLKIVSIGMLIGAILTLIFFFFPL